MILCAFALYGELLLAALATLAVTVASAAAVTVARDLHDMARWRRRK